MLSCHGCMRHCLQAIIGRPLLNSARSKPQTRIPYGTISRKYASSQTAYHERRESRNNESNDAAITSNSFGARANRFEQNRQEWLKSRGTRPEAQVKRRPNLDTELSMKKHLQYLQDPMKLSNYVRSTLRNDDFETAEKVVHFASKKMQCVVSWNHLVDWQLSKGRMNAAIKIFNDV